MNTEQIIDNLLNLINEMRKPYSSYCNDFSFKTEDLPSHQNYTIEFVLRDAGKPVETVENDSFLRFTGFWATGDADRVYYALLEDTYRQRNRNSPKPSPNVWIQNGHAGIMYDEKGNRLIYRAP